MEDLSTIFGKSAWEILKTIDGLSLLDADLNDRSCLLVLNGFEYRIKREHYRRWHAVTTGYWKTFGSQWELLAWIGDRL